MEKMSKGNKNGPVSKSVPEKEEAFSNASDGSMDYLSKMDKFDREDSSKLNRNAFPNSRYK